MDRVSCPHCNSHHSVNTGIPQNAVVVVQCPDCSEWAVCFQSKICALDRRILEEGTSRERKLHLAKIIAEFLEPMLSKIGLINMMEEGGAPVMGGSGAAFDLGESDGLPPISEKEHRDFVRFELKRIDNPDYFKKNLGSKK